MSKPVGLRGMGNVRFISRWALESLLVKDIPTTISRGKQFFSSSPQCLSPHHQHSRPIEPTKSGHAPQIAPIREVSHLFPRHLQLLTLGVTNPDTYSLKPLLLSATKWGILPSRHHQMASKLQALGSLPSKPFEHQFFYTKPLQFIAHSTAPSSIPSPHKQPKRHRKSKP